MSIPISWFQQRYSSASIHKDDPAILNISKTKHQRCHTETIHLSSGLTSFHRQLPEYHKLHVQQRECINPANVDTNADITVPPTTKSEDNVVDPTFTLLRRWPWFMNPSWSVISWSYTIPKIKTDRWDLDTTLTNIWQPLSKPSFSQQQHYNRQRQRKCKLSTTSTIATILLSCNEINLVTTNYETKTFFKNISYLNQD